jgi:TonB-linked SusC/RagA family outer membrane protein
VLDRKYTDWEDMMIKPAIQQKYDLSVRSSSATTKILASVGWFDQQGMIQPAAFQRANFRFNAEHKLSKWLTVGVNSSYTQSNRTQEDESFSKFLTESPVLSPYDENGKLLNMLADSKWNPVWNNKNMTNETESNRLLLNLSLDWDIAFVKGLKYRLNASLDARNSERGTYLNSLHEKGSASQGKATIDIDKSENYLIENIFTFDYKINELNKFDLTFVQSANKMESTSTAMAGYGFATDGLGYNNIGAASKTDPVVRSITPRNLLSYMGRLRYNLMDKYLFSASARIDGSSVFGKNNKWGFFPAASFGWRISEEDVIRDYDWLSNLKLRLSYGDVGNQAIDPYQSQGLVDSYFMQFGSNEPLVGYLPGSQLPNPDLKWETTSSFNAGLDFGFFRDRITGTVEWYRSVTHDLLYERSINQTTGYSTQLVNIGSVLNKGFELSFNFIPVKTNNLTWSIDMNYSTNKNEILELNGKTDDVANKLFIGHNVDAYYDYAFDGIRQIGEVIIPDYGSVTVNPGDIKVKDVNGDKFITPDDRIVIDRAPDWTGAIGSTLKWNGFDFGFDFYIVQGVTRQNAYLYDSNSGGDLHGKLNGIKVDYWTIENPSNTAPRPRDATISYFSSLSYQDASYIRLRNVSLGYSFDKQLLKPLGISKLRIYVTAANFWTKTDYLSYSPEVSAGGYPEPKTFVAGLNVSF